MTNQKPAMLDSSILARKGEAVPAASGHYAAQKKATPKVAVTNTSPETRTGVKLRLGQDEYLRLKLIAVHTQRTHQDIMRVALTGYLDSLAETIERDCPCVSEGKAPSDGCCLEGDDTEMPSARFGKRQPLRAVGGDGHGSSGGD